MNRTLISIISGALLLASCSEEGPGAKDDGNTFGNNGIAADNGTPPAFSQSVAIWRGEKASDASADAVGTNPDIYYELSTFPRKVTVEFAGDGATVSTDNPSIRTYTQGAYVTVDFQTAGVSGVELIVKGQTADGGLKIYGGNKFKLTLDGANIKSNKGPAINNQCKKRVFVNLADGTTNSLTDCVQYTDDPYYKAGTSAETEDRKGCFFSEGDMIFSGTGVLAVKGLSRHGIAADGYMAIRPGSTVAVTEAAKNCIHLKGDLTDDMGLWVIGGYLYGLTNSPAGKAVKTDQNIRIDGGKVVLNTTGDGIFDTETNDTSSAACLKADTYVNITGGNIELRSTGKGGKGINATTTVAISGGTIGASCSGSQYIYSETLTASAKAIKALGDITISGGTLIALSTGNSDNSRGIESDTSIAITGAKTTVYAYDDALNAPAITLGEGATISAYSIADDGIRGKDKVLISGANVTAVGGSSPASGISCNTSQGFTITGGEIVAMGGSLRSTPSATTVSYRIWDGFTAEKGSTISVSNGAQTLYTLPMPRTIEGGVILIAAPDIFATTAALTLFSGTTPCANPSILYL